MFILLISCHFTNLLKVLFYAKIYHLEYIIKRIVERLRGEETKNEKENESKCEI